MHWMDGSVCVYIFIAVRAPPAALVLQRKEPPGDVRHEHPHRAAAASRPGCAHRAPWTKPRPRFRPRRLVCRCVEVPERRAAGAALVRRPPRGVLQRLLHDAGYSPKRRNREVRVECGAQLAREGRTKLGFGVWRSVGVHPVRGIGFSGGSRFRALGLAGFPGSRHRF